MCSLFPGRAGFARATERCHVYGPMHDDTATFGTGALFRVKVPASTSNLGAGFDCLGLALDLWLEARIVEGRGGPEYSGTLAGMDSGSDFLHQAVAGVLPEHTHLEVHSDILLSHGLGSSAAARVAGLALARAVVESPVIQDEVFEMARKLEGHPDNAGPAVYGGLVLYAGRPARLRFHTSLGIAIALPEQSINTEEARAILPRQFSMEETVLQASRSAALVLGLTRGDGDLVRYGMADCIAVPTRKMLIAGFDDAVQAGEEAGAYGVTISGAGSGLVAVCDKASTREVAERMAEALSWKGNPATPLTPGIAETGLETSRARALPPH